ncbi:MAG TPA: DUF2007 domain-containing protein [Oleiagrimonas sp.]|nr:DUF2007 domain-containing protein [Oleiagrimonas sp.]
MREIYTSPRPENIDRVVALFAEHGIETRVTNRSVYNRPSYQRFSYGASEDRSRWARVEVKYAADLTRARELLRELGIAPLTRYAEVLEASREPRKHRSPEAVARRVRTAVLVVLAVAVVILLVKLAS